jgi:hypothetical protein
MKPAVFLLLATAGFAQDNTDALARILAAKGTISAAELAQVEGTAPTDRLPVLADILQHKGVLSAGDMAQLRLQPPSANAAASAAHPTGAAARSSTAQGTATRQPQSTSAPATAVTTESHFPVTLYGMVLLNSVYNTAPMNITDIPLFAVKAPAPGDDKAFAMTARQTRLGLKFRSPTEILEAKLSGQVEVDFLGGKAPLGNGVNMDLVRLRMAFGRLDWKHVSLEAGQDWSIFAPLNPTSLAEYAIPSLSAAGNPWIRMPQIRAEVRGEIAKRVNVLAQFAAIDPNMGDYDASTFSAARLPGIGERGRAPGAEARLAFTRKYEARDFTVGFSGHYAHGKNFGTIGGITQQISINSWGAAIDYSLPFTRYFNLTGELYTGRELGIFSVTSGEAIEPVGIIGDIGVRSSGGWMQAQFNFAKRWQTNLAYGIDDPEARDIQIGLRTRNQNYMGNIMFKPSTHFNIAWEYRRILTDYRNRPFANERGDTLNLAFGYFF